jgi:Family of unknown function (DUF6228)
MENFTIYSASSDRSVTFSNHSGDYFQVDLKGENLAARIKVYAYTDAFGLNTLFQELATHSKPWAEAKKWESLEGEFSISATCSTLGNVLFHINMRMLPGHPEESSLSTGISSELGQISNIAKEAERFFSSSS